MMAPGQPQARPPAGYALAMPPQAAMGPVGVPSPSTPAVPDAARIPDLPDMASLHKPLAVSTGQAEPVTKPTRPYRWSKCPECRTPMKHKNLGSFSCGIGGVFGCGSSKSLVCHVCENDPSAG